MVMRIMRPNMGSALLASGSPRATRIVAAPSDRWPFHDDESGALQMPNNAIGDNRSHVFIRIVDTLPAAEQQGESDRFGEVLRFRA